VYRSDQKHVLLTMNLLRRVVILTMVVNAVWWATGCAILLWELRSPDHRAYQERRSRSGHYYKSTRAAQSGYAVLFYGVPIAWTARSLYLATRGRDDGDRDVGAFYYALLMALCAAALLLLGPKMTPADLADVGGPRALKLRAGWYAACAAAAAALALRPRGR
jgi:hypothetical protein